MAHDDEIPEPRPSGVGLVVLLLVIVLLVWWLTRRGKRDDDELPFPSDHVARGVSLGGHDICGPGCTSPVDLGGVLTCETQRECLRRGCTCHLFSRSTDAPPQDPDSWKHEAPPDTEVREQQGREYRCFCVG